MGDIPEDEETRMTDEPKKCARCKNETKPGLQLVSDSSWGLVCLKCEQRLMYIRGEIKSVPAWARKDTGAL